MVLKITLIIIPLYVYLLLTKEFLIKINTLTSFFRGLKLKLQEFPGGTDSRYLRGLGIPALGFSPINKTPVLLHDNDEFIRVDTFLKGIEVYTTLIPAVANVQ